MKRCRSLRSGGFKFLQYCSHAECDDFSRWGLHVLFCFIKIRGNPLTAVAPRSAWYILLGLRLGPCSSRCELTLPHATVCSPAAAAEYYLWCRRPRLTDRQTDRQLVSKVRLSSNMLWCHVIQRCTWVGSIHGFGRVGLGPVVKFSKKNCPQPNYWQRYQITTVGKVEAVELVRRGCEMGWRPTGDWRKLECYVHFYASYASWDLILTCIQNSNRHLK